MIFCRFAIVAILYYLETHIKAKGSILTESIFFLINDIFFATQRVVKIRNANNRVTEYVRTVLKFFEVKHKSKDRLQMGFRIHADLNTKERRRWQEYIVCNIQLFYIFLNCVIFKKQSFYLKIYCRYVSGDPYESWQVFILFCTFIFVMKYRLFYANSCIFILSYQHIIKLQFLFMKLYYQTTMYSVLLPKNFRIMN